VRLGFVAPTNPPPALPLNQTRAAKPAPRSGAPTLSNVRDLLGVRSPSPRRPFSAFSVTRGPVLRSRHPIGYGRHPHPNDACSAHRQETGALPVLRQPTRHAQGHAQEEDRDRPTLALRFLQARLHAFAPGLRNGTYPLHVVLDAITLYDLGYSLEQTAEKIRVRFGRRARAGWSATTAPPPSASPASA
jgi:hypothetical protein